jgi:GNAT superfamily N-acetyltransferase
MIRDEPKFNLPGSAVNVRRALASDADGMASVSMRAWHLNLKDIVPEGFLDQFVFEKQREKYAERALNSTWILLVAEFDGKIGMIGAQSNDSEPLIYDKQIKVMYVDPDFQNQGIGKALLASLFAELKKQGVERAMLWCITANEVACSFYEKLGAKRIESIKPPAEYGAMPHVVYAWDSLDEGANRKTT